MNHRRFFLGFLDASKVHINGLLCGIDDSLGTQRLASLDGYRAHLVFVVLWPLGGLGIVTLTQEHSLIIFEHLGVHIALACQSELDALHLDEVST